MSGAEADRSRQLEVLDLDKGSTISERAYYAYNLTTVVKGTLELKLKQLLFEPDRRDENVLKAGSPAHFRICFSLHKISGYTVIDSAKEDKEKAKKEKERLREEKKLKKLNLIQEVTAENNGDDGSNNTYRADDYEIRGASRRGSNSVRSSLDEDRKSSPKSKNSSRSSSRRSSKEMDRKSEERERSNSISSIDSNRSKKESRTSLDKNIKEKKEKKIGKEIILQINFTSNKPHLEHHGKVLHFVFKKKSKKFKKILLRLRALNEKFVQERMMSDYMVDTMASPGDMKSPSSLSRSGLSLLRDSGSESEAARQFAFEELKPRLHDESKILGPNSLKQIWRFLPFRLKIKDWSLVYSNIVHGASFSTFSRKIEGKGPTLLLIKDTGGYVFGAYVTEEWKKSDTFYGLGENFLFSLEPTAHVYYWTKQNDLFHFFNDDFFAFGGSKSGKYGLYVDNELHKGTSEVTETFLNRPLGSQEQFTISTIEVWNFIDKN